MRGLRRDRTGQAGSEPLEQDDSAPDQGQPQTQAPAPNRRRVWVTRGVAALALILIGAGLTYLIAPPVAAPAKVVTIKAKATTTDADAQVSPMPSLAGLSAETAQLVMRDAGAGDAEVTTSRRPAAGPPGLVLEQSPSPGSEIGKKVALVLSTPMETPNLTGAALADAQAQLQKLGAVVRVTEVIKPGGKAGKVLSSDPVAGTTLPVVVTLRVLDPGVSLSLADLGENDSQNCSSDSDVNVGGTTAPSAVTCDLSEAGEGPSYMTYTLGRRPLALTFTPGRNTEAGPGTGTIRVLGDGKQLTSVDVGGSGTAPKQTVNLSGVGTLRIEVTGTSDDPDNDPLQLVLANAALHGAGADISALENQ